MDSVARDSARYNHFLAVQGRSPYGVERDFPGLEDRARKATPIASILQ
jgi:hypothetical protein